MSRLLLIGLLIVVVTASFAGGEATFEQARPGRSLNFPADHGKHPQFQTEWWYFTGNLASEDDRKWGFQLTFFRRALKKGTDQKSAWAVQDLYPTHFAITDVKNGRFFHTDIISREGPGLARAAEDRLLVKVKDWLAEQQGDRIHVAARKNGFALDLTLIPEKPLVLHGDKGYSRKGDNESQASYYYSFTRLKASGTITFDSTPYSATGSAWMDHEFGSSLLSAEQAGWDWFSLQFDDGSELMAFYLRRRDGSFETPFGSLVQPDGSVVALSGQDLAIRPIATWTSPRTKAVYPSGWTIDVPHAQMTLRVSPMIADQEINAEKSTGIIYWEGAVSVQGSKDGKSVTGRGYVELTGYAHSMAGRL